MITEITTEKVDDIIIIENFLSPRYLEHLYEFITQVPEEKWWDHNYDDVEFWNGRFYNAHEVHKDGHPYMANIMWQQRKRVIKIIKSIFKKDTMYSDLCQFVRWFDGYELTPHADAEEPDGSPHPFPYREYASIIYLNDNFTGGEIYFPNKNFSPKIKPGMLVLFPGTLEYLHGVREVTEGTRYTLCSFYTSQKEHSDDHWSETGISLG